MPDVAELFRASHEAPVLLALLCDQLDINEAMLMREQTAKGTEWEIARLTALRFLFSKVIINIQPINTAEKLKALVWIRKQKLGRLVLALLDDVITATRYTYETNTASESTRLLLRAYKTTKHILYVESTEQMYGNNIAE